jgi:hypothetical protein
MNSKSEVAADPAAIFACAGSLWEERRKFALEGSLDLSNTYCGWDQLMREVMRIGELFEKWACEHVDFASLGEVWPYLLGERFGSACLAVLYPTELAAFNEKDCLRVALRLKVPLLAKSRLHVPVDLAAANPAPNGGFKAFRIQTVRTILSDECVEPFTPEDDPYDPDYSEPYFGIYGLCYDEYEHICDRKDLADAVALVEKLAPGIVLKAK